jgi:hypothetical protein
MDIEQNGKLKLGESITEGRCTRKGNVYDVKAIGAMQIFIKLLRSGVGGCGMHAHALIQEENDGKSQRRIWQEVDAEMTLLEEAHQLAR